MFGMLFFLNLDCIVYFTVCHFCCSVTFLSLKLTFSHQICIDSRGLCMSHRKRPGHGGGSHRVSALLQAQRRPVGLQPWPISPPRCCCWNIWSMNTWLSTAVTSVTSRCHTWVRNGGRRIPPGTVIWIPAGQSSATAGAVGMLLERWWGRGLAPQRRHTVQRLMAAFHQFKLVTLCSNAWWQLKESD